MAVQRLEVKSTSGPGCLKTIDILNIYGSLSMAGFDILIVFNVLSL